jgi:hypothetical protein
MIVGFFISETYPKIIAGIGIKKNPIFQGCSPGARSRREAQL